jgi:hypothetical protein
LLDLLDCDGTQLGLHPGRYAREGRAAVDVDVQYHGVCVCVCVPAS